MWWSRPLTKGKTPEPRGGHTATTIGNKLYIFAGGAHPNAFRDLHIFDMGMSICTLSRGTVVRDITASFCKVDLDARSIILILIKSSKFTRSTLDALSLSSVP